MEIDTVVTVSLTLQNFEDSYTKVIKVSMIHTGQILEPAKVKVKITHS